MNSPKQNSYHVLVVDDDPSVSACVRLTLAHGGHTAQTANSGDLALTLFEPGRFNLAIVDYFMPGMKGDQLAARLKQQQPNLPIIMATAYAEQVQGNAELRADVALFLSKPFSVTELYEAVAKVMTNPSAPGEALPPAENNCLQPAGKP